MTLRLEKRVEKARGIVTIDVRAWDGDNWVGEYEVGQRIFRARFNEPMTIELLDEIRGHFAQAMALGES